MSHQTGIASDAAIFAAGCSAGPLRLAGRSRLVLGVSLAAMVAAAVAVAPRASLAANECGPAAPGDTVVCTSDGNTYPTGIEYFVDDLTIVLEDGVVVNTIGNFDDGVLSWGEGDLSVVTEDTVRIITTGLNANGIYVEATNSIGAVSIDNAGNITTIGNDANGIVTWAEYGPTTIENSGSILTTGDYAAGIKAFTDYGAISITNMGAITTSGDHASGIFARQYGYDGGTGLVSIESLGNITTSGLGAHGIAITSVEDFELIVSGDITTSGLGGSAIVAGSILGSGSVNTVDSTISASGDYSRGIIAGGFGSLGSLSIYAGAITTTGEHFSQGILAINQGDITVTALEVSTLGENSAGIFVISNGNVDVTVGDVTTHGADSPGVYAYTDEGDVTVTVLGDVTTSGLGASGIVVSNDLGDFEVIVSGDVTTSGDNAPAIDASTADGSGYVKTVDGTISTSGDNSAGVLAYANGSLVVHVGTVTTTGDNSPGVEAFDPVSDVTVTALDVTTFGDNSAGIIAGSDLADVDVTVTDVTTHGADSLGVYAFSDLGDVTVTVLGDVETNGPGSSGVVVQSQEGLQSVVVGPGGSISSGPDAGPGLEGFTAAVVFEGPGGASLSNNGLIEAANDMVVRSFSSLGTTINNFGTMIGHVFLGDGADTFNNHAGGLFQARGDSYFEGGFDRFINEGTLRVTDGPVTFHDLEVFDNSAGTITMIDNDTDDSLTLPGEFVGGGSLGVDAIIGPDGDSDQLIIQGIVSGDPTAVSVNIIDITGPSTDGITVIVLENGAPADHFFLSGGPIDTGLFQVDLLGVADGFRLMTIPDEGNIASPVAAPHALAALGNEITGQFDRTNEMLESQGVPGVAQIHAGSWAKVVGSSLKQDTRTSFTLADMPMRQSDRFDLGLVGLLGGLDVSQSGVRNGTNYAWLLGALGGFVWADVDFSTATGNQDINAAVVGAYAGLAYGGFRLHMLGKIDFGDVTFNEPDLAPGLSARDESDFSTVSLETNIGYKISLPNTMYVQPIASLYYSTTQLEDATLAGTTVEFDDFDSLRARAGLRLGANIVGKSHVIDPWVQASVWRELLDPDTNVTLASGGSSLELIGAGVETYGEVGAGVNVVHIGPGLSGQVRFDAKFGEMDLVALSGQVGLEYRFAVK